MDPASLAAMILTYNKLALTVVGLFRTIKHARDGRPDLNLPEMMTLEQALEEFETARSVTLERNRKWFRDHGLPVPE